jgi:hypothetical protein
LHGNNPDAASKGVHRGVARALSQAHDRGGLGRAESRPLAKGFATPDAYLSICSRTSDNQIMQASRQIAASRVNNMMVSLDTLVSLCHVVGECLLPGDSLKNRSPRGCNGILSIPFPNGLMPPSLQEC